MCLLPGKFYLYGKNGPPLAGSVSFDDNSFDDAGNFPM